MARFTVILHAEHFHTGVYSENVEATDAEKAKELAVDQHIVENGLADEHDHDDMSIQRKLIIPVFVFSGYHKNLMDT